MWRENTSAADSAAADFDEWISDTLPGLMAHRNLRTPEPDEPLSLLMLLELWLTDGNGFYSCPTFESFLVATIVIIDDWERQDKRIVSGTTVPLNNPGARIPLFAEEGNEEHPATTGARGYFGVLQRDKYLYLHGMHQLVQDQNSARRTTSNTTK